MNLLFGLFKFSSIALIVSLLSGCFSFRMSANSYNEYFELQNIEYTEYDIDSGIRTIHAISTGTTDSATLIFLHGAPGSSSTFKKYLSENKLLSNYSLIAIDRPGYGYSDFGRSVTDFERQSQLISEIFNIIPEKNPVILIGHSVGGAIAAQLAIDNPKIIDGLILIDPTINPSKIKVNHYRKIFNAKIIRWLVPRALKVSNHEKLLLKKEVLKLRPNLKQIPAEIIIVESQIKQEDEYSFEQLFNREDITFLNFTESKHASPENHIWEIIPKINDIIVNIYQSK